MSSGGRIGVLEGGCIFRLSSGVDYLAASVIGVITKCSLNTYYVGFIGTIQHRKACILRTYLPPKKKVNKCTCGMSDASHKYVNSCREVGSYNGCLG